jgi:hypothetical protein
MARPEFETVVAMSPREKMVKADISSNTTVLAGNGESKLIYAPTGFIGELVALYLIGNPPPGAVSGSHGFNFGYFGTALASGESNFGQNVQWRKGCWEVADKYQFPPVQQSQGLIPGQVIFDDVVPLEVFYYNYSNVSQTTTRTIYVHYKLRQIAK